MNEKTQKKYFPIFIDLSEKAIVVIGGGTIASRRVHTLVNFAEKIMVVSPKMTETLQELYEQGKIDWKQEEYQIEQIKNADMVIAATNQKKVNEQVKADCQKLEKEMGRQIFVSVIDDRELCDFYFPSIVQTEDVTIGINSGGKSPSLTKRVREQIEKILKCKSIYQIR